MRSSQTMYGLQQRVNVGCSLVICLMNEPFLDWIATGDEKWRVGKRETTTTQAKEVLHPCKLLLSVWWNEKGLVDCEHLDPNQDILCIATASSLSGRRQHLEEENSLWFQEEKCSTIRIMLCERQWRWHSNSWRRSEWKWWSTHHIHQTDSVDEVYRAVLEQ